MGRFCVRHDRGSVVLLGRLVDRILVPRITVYVHRIDVGKHPTWGTGYRWAVHGGGIPPNDILGCLHAGKEGTLMLAKAAGEACGVTAAKALRMFGVPAEILLEILDHDPLSATEDRVSVMSGGL